MKRILFDKNRNANIHKIAEVKLKVIISLFFLWKSELCFCCGFISHNSSFSDNFTLLITNDKKYIIKLESSGCNDYAKEQPIFFTRKFGFAMKIITIEMYILHNFYNVVTPSTYIKRTMGHVTAWYIVYTYYCANVVTAINSLSEILVIKYLLT